MDTHELKLMDFEDALDRVETRLVEIRQLIQDSASDAPKDKIQALAKSKADAEAHLVKLRQMKTAELSGERDNLLTEVETVLDQIGKKVSDLF